MWLLWLVILIVALVFEAASLNMITLWFAFGALGAMLVDFFHLSFVWQLGVFFAVSILGLIIFVLCFKPRLSKQKTSLVRTNADRILGEQAVVLRSIEGPEAPGIIRVLGQEWTAIAQDSQEIIPQDSLVRVEDISGVKAVVSRIS